MQITDITPKIKPKVEKIRLAAYCRVSSNSEEQIHSYMAQIKYYSDYVKTHTEYELVDIYADEGLTGTEVDNRKDLDRLLSDAKKGKIDKVIVKSISRFMRNTQECLIALRTLKNFGVTVFFEEQGIDTDKLNSELIVTFPGMLAQQESENISGNLRWGIKKRMEKGEYVCSNPAYGYVLVNNEMVINEIEAIVVRNIFNMYLNGYGINQIAHELNRKGIPNSKGGKLWRESSVRYILTNEKYKGDAILGKRYTTDTLPFRQKKNNGEKPKFYVENYNPSIVTKETFDTVQKLMEQKRSKQGEIITYLLSKTMFCPECGAMFRRQVLKDKAYWFCGKLATGESECKSRRVKEEMVYDTFTRMIYKLKDNRERLIENLIKRLEFVQQKTSNSIERIKEIDKEIADLSAKNLVITRLHTSGILNTTDYSMQTSEILNKISELRTERKKKLGEDENDVMLDDMKNLNKILIELELKSKFDSELFSQVVEKIVVDDNTQLTFYLIGGLRFTEKISEKGRCKVA